MIVIRMTRNTPGAANALGSKTTLYQSGTKYDMPEPWQERLAAIFIGGRRAKLISGEFPVDADAPEVAVTDSPRHRTEAPEPIRRHAGHPEMQKLMEATEEDDVAEKLAAEIKPEDMAMTTDVKNAGGAPENKMLGAPENKAVRSKHAGRGKWCHVDADDERVDERLFDSEAEAKAAL